MLRLITSSSKKILSTQRSTSCFQRTLSTAVSTTSTTSSSNTPSVFDNIVQLNFIDPSGARRQVPGYVGEYNMIMMLSRLL